jgi:tyrosyl-tRNA synthetase
MSAFDVLQERGFVKQFTAGARELLDAEQVTFYVGFDPTGDSLHVGHLLPVMAMAHLQRAGHRPIAVVGGGTAMVGDPSGKDEMRKLITTEQIEHNKACLKQQLGLLLEFDGPSATGGMLIDNADWLLKLNYIEFLRDIGSQFSVNQMLGKASVKLRLEKGLSFIEFNYQILQAYDFKVLAEQHNCLLQMGGDDQWGNITAGVDLVRRKLGKEAHGLTFPLLTRSDGKKMGKTEKGAVWLDPNKMSPYDYFQYWINVDDRDVGKLLRIFTFLPMSRVVELEALTGADVREAKRELAFHATAVVHGQTEAQKAAEGARAAFAGGGAVAAMPTLEVSFPVSIVQALVESGLCKSNSDARRQIKGGAVKMGLDRKTGVTNHELSLAESTVIWRGKKNAVRLV